MDRIINDIITISLPCLKGWTDKQTEIELQKIVGNTTSLGGYNNYFQYDIHGLSDDEISKKLKEVKLTFNNLLLKYGKE